MYRPGGGVDMRLRTGLPILWRATTQVQLGTDPRWAAVLADLSPAACRALCTVPHGSDRDTVRSALRREGAPDAEVGALLEHLRSARLLVGAPAHDDAPDVSAWSTVAEDGHGAAVLAHRGTSVVRIEGLGRVGAMLAGLVATAGIGTVELDDPQVVGPRDIGLGGIGVRDVGTARTGAVARAMHDVAPQVRTITSPAGHNGLTGSASPRGPRPTLTVLVEQHVADPTRYAALTQDDQPHLSVVVREASVLVGPLVRPGETACLRCLDLHRTERDPAWPQIATQLLTARHGPTHARAGSPSPGGAETVTAATASALAAAAVLAMVDGRPTELTDASFEIALPGATPRRRRWTVHPDCGCNPPSGSGRSGE